MPMLRPGRRPGSPLVGSTHGRRRDVRRRSRDRVGDRYKAVEVYVHPERLKVCRMCAVPFFCSAVHVGGSLVERSFVLDPDGESLVETSGQSQV